MTFPLFAIDIDLSVFRGLEIPIIALVAGVAFYFVASWFLTKKPSGPPGARKRPNAGTASPSPGSTYSSTPAVAPFGEKRAAFRRDGNPTPVYLSDIDFLDDPFDAWVIDRSLGGLCLCLDRSLPVGAVLNVRSRNAPETIPWVQIEVRTCRKEEDGHHIGCRFVRTPSWSVMLHFG